MSRYLLRLLLLTAVYYAAARLGLSMALVQGNASPVWPPTGVALAALLLLGRRYWPMAAVGTLLAAAPTGVSLSVLAAFAVGNTLEGVVGATLLARVTRIRPGLARVRDVLAYLALGAGLAPMISAGVGVGALVLGGVVPTGDMAGVWLVWWTGNAAGALVVGAALLVWSREPLRAPRAGFWKEYAALVLSLLVASAVAFEWRAGGTAVDYPVAYVAFPFMIWAALRLGQRGATTVGVIVSTVAIVATIRGVGPFSRETVQESLLFLQAFVCALTLSGLVLAAVTAERERVLRGERRARARALEAQRRASLLAEIGEALGGSLDYREALGGIARLCVARLADACIVDEVRQDGEFGAVVTLHRDPARGAALEELRRRYPPIANPNSSVRRVLHRARAELVPRMDEAYLARISMDPEHHRLLAAFPFHSSIVAPLLARGRSVGVLTLVREDSSPPYSARDLLLAEEVGRRAALWLDNARLFEETSQAALARKKVVQMVSHEVRNPLSTVLLNASALLDTAPAGTRDDWTADGLRSIVLAAEQIQALLVDLVDITRLEFHPGAMDRYAIAPALLLERAALMLEPIARRHGLSLVVERAGRLPCVAGSQDRTLQVFSNLVGNAVRFTPEGGRITFRAEVVGEEVVFSVSDTGSGIPLERQEHLFTPVWEAPGDQWSGSGLGLPLARTILEAQGGRIWVESAPGAGATFSFTLPVQGATHASEAPVAPG